MDITRITVAACKRLVELGYPVRTVNPACYPAEDGMCWIDQFPATSGAGILQAPNGHFYDNREDPIVIQVVEELGEASGMRLVEVPDGIEWYVDELEGFEYVAEQHRTWGI